VKILQIFRQFLPATGGIERVMYGLSKALLQKGHSIDIVTLRTLFNTGTIAKPTDVIDGLNVYRLSHIGYHRYPIAPGILPFAPHYDIIHIHAIDFFVDFLTLTRAYHRVPIVVHTHGGIFHTKWMLPLKKLFFQTITRLSLYHVNAVLCDSQHDYELFQPIVPQSKLHIVANGLDIQPFVSLNKEITPGLLLGIGRIVENKQIDRIIELLPTLAQDFPDIRLVWVGVDRHHWIPRFMARAQELGVASRVYFTGEIADVDVYDWLKRAHLFVSASSYEAFGVSTIEAMSSCTVPVVTPVGVHPEVVHDGATGFLYEFAGQKAQECFRHALSLDETSLREMGSEAQRVARRYSWDEVVESYLSIYQQVCKGNES
jgi:alpha-1,3-mannosyltransferase